jgi:hypothetical protein
LITITNHSQAGLIRHFSIRIPWPYNITEELESDEEEDDDADDNVESDNHDSMETDPQYVMSEALEAEQEDDRKQLIPREKAEVHQGPNEDSLSNYCQIPY